MILITRLLDDSSNTAWTYCSTTLTLPVLDLSLSSTMLFVDFMLFLGTTYIMYFYFPKLLEPFWSHLNSSTSTSICLSFYCNNSYENWKWTKSLRDGLPRLWRSFLLFRKKAVTGLSQDSIVKARPITNFKHGLSPNNCLWKEYHL